jgi:predicted N-acetyltransferase YhbS
MNLTIRSLDEADLSTADQIFRQAFGKYLGMPDPQAFTGDAAILATRWRANRAAVLGAYSEGSLLGSSLAARWGSFGFLEPVSVRPDMWDQGVPKQLVKQTVAMLDQWGVGQAS